MAKTDTKQGYDITQLPDYDKLSAPMVKLGELVNRVVTIHSVEYKVSRYEDSDNEEYMNMTITVDNNPEMFICQSASAAVDRLCKSALKHKMLPITFLLVRSGLAYETLPAPSS